MLIALSLCATVSGAVDQFSIDHTTDAAYLPYSLDSVRFEAYEFYASGSESITRVYSQRVGDSGRPVVSAAHQPPITSDAPSSIGFYDILERIWVAELPMSGFYRNHTFSKLPSVDSTILLRLSLWDDSLFVVKQVMGDPDFQDTLFVATGEDETGDGSWRGSGGFLAATDCDGAGEIEQLAYVQTGRDKRPRKLLCIDPVTMTLKWQHSISSILLGSEPVATDERRGLVFWSYGVWNGVEDSVFSDEFSYVGRFDGYGKVVWRHIGGVNFKVCPYVRLTSDTNLIAVAHTLPLGLAPDSARAYQVAQPQLSLVRIDNGSVVKTVPRERLINNLWLTRLDRDTALSLCTISPEGVISVYDQQLHLIRESNPTELHGIVDTIRIAGQSNPCMLLMHSERVSLYSSSFKQLATIPCSGYGDMQPVAIDADGNVTHFALAEGLLGTVSRRGFVDYLTVWFWRWRIYVLSVLTALVVGLIVTNYFRHKARSTMLLIASQKRELEETHAQLKAAQAKIVAQEKFRQARDIAGGFAHEIRNALFPVTAELHKRRKATGRSEDPDELVASDRRIERAVSRALDVTDACSEYTRLEGDYDPAPANIHQTVRAALELVDDVIERAGVEIEIDGDPELKVVAGRSHLQTVFEHLILNSVDALADADSPKIAIRWLVSEDVTRIAVRDNGEGIKPEHRERVFETFFSTRPRTGLGLGLAIVKKIVEMYDGEIVIESTLGEGTTVEFSLPVA